VADDFRQHQATAFRQLVKQRLGHSR
jgi:hypothetical protein